MNVNGCFRHRMCIRVAVTGKAFPKMTCAACRSIPGDDDFRLRVTYEDRAVEKRGTRDTGMRKKIGYLSVNKLSNHSRNVMKKLRQERFLH